MSIEDEGFVLVEPEEEQKPIEPVVNTVVNIQDEIQEARHKADMLKIEAEQEEYNLRIATAKDKMGLLEGRYKYQSELDSLSNQLNELKIQLDNRASELDNRESELNKNIESKFNDRELELNNREVELNIKEQDLIKEFNVRNAKLDDYNNKLNDKDNAITKREKALSATEVRITKIKESIETLKLDPDVVKNNEKLTNELAEKEKRFWLRLKKLEDWEQSKEGLKYNKGR